MSAVIVTDTATEAETGTAIANAVTEAETVVEKIRTSIWMTK